MNTVTQTESPVKIEYNRSTRRYEWIDPDSGEMFTAPSGAKNKANLFQAVIGMLDPDLYASATRMIENNPQLERVVWKAVELVTNNAVEVFAVPNNGVVAMVDSSDGYGRYAITMHTHGIDCQCEHYQSMAAPLTNKGHRICKHIAAKFLWQYTREDRF